MRVYVDASVKNGHAAIAYATDRTSGKCRLTGRFEYNQTFAAELLGVVLALQAYQDDPIEIVCDHRDVVAGINGRRYPISHIPDVGQLWEQYDAARSGRNVVALLPQNKNKGMHRVVHKLAIAESRRAVRKV